MLAIVSTFQKVSTRSGQAHARVEVRLQRTESTEAAVEGAGVDVMGYDSKWGRYRIRLQRGDLAKHAGLLRQLMEAAYQEAGGSEA